MPLVDPIARAAYERSPTRIESRRARDRARYASRIEYRRKYGRDYYHVRKKEERELGRTSPWSKDLPAPTRVCPMACELCGNPPGKFDLALDHDHETGAFRGWLCGRCNTTLGQLGDTAMTVATWAAKAADYLKAGF